MRNSLATLLIAVIVLGSSVHKPGFAQPGDSGANDSVPAVIPRSDGFYNTYDTSRLPCGERASDRYKMYEPLFIINSITALHIMGASFTGDGLSMHYLTRLPMLPSYVGSIKVVGKILTATLPTALNISGMRRRLFCVHFEAEIKSRDTIINWRMVPPYPKAKRKYNDDFTGLLSPRLLYFVEDKACLSLDSLVSQRLEKQEIDLRR